MTKKLFILLLSVLFHNLVYSQTQAITEDGDTIYIYNNGTWSYEPQDDMPLLENDMGFLADELQLDTIKGEFFIPKSANKTLKNSRGQFIIKYNSALWERVPPATLNDEAEFALQSKTTDLWCIVISEETEIEASSLFKIARQTMEDNTGATTEIVKSEVRKVNGYDVVRGTLRANLSGISFMFDTYYFSNELGSVQFTIWTGDNIWKKNEKRILELLNGFQVL